VSETSGQVDALRAFGIGIALVLAGALVLTFGGPIDVAWLPFMALGAREGVVTMRRARGAGLWRAALLLPLGLLLLILAALGLLAPFAM
jgi:hypothetical protein